MASRKLIKQEKKCPNCKGTGKGIKYKARSGINMQIACQRCYGIGKVKQESAEATEISLLLNKDVSCNPLNPVSILTEALLELNEFSQLCPQTIKKLKEMR